MFLAGCVSTKEETTFILEPLDTPKEIALVGTRYPWMTQIEIRLRDSGFKIKRFASVSEATEKISETKSETYSEASTRVLMVVDGYAPNTSYMRCFGGGYDFQFINVELIDVSKNETIATYANSGFTEDCPPMSGTIFTDINNMVNNTFK
tara:strand:- start:594 stop:1043 length:450 start_codon:yes stop_codon:yes gene_type:complete